MAVNLQAYYGNTAMGPPITNHQGLQLYTKDKKLEENIQVQLTGAIYYNGEVGPAQIPVPTINGTYSYTGQLITPTWDYHGYDSIISLISGGSGTDAGIYTAAFILTDPNMEWEGGGSGTKYVDWQINPALLPKPYPKGDQLWTGNVINVSSPDCWYDYDTTKMIIGDTTSGTNKGVYTASFTLRNSNNYAWEDNTSTPASVDWRIWYYIIQICTDVNPSWDPPHMAHEDGWKIDPTIDRREFSTSIYDGVYVSQNPSGVEKLIINHWAIRIAFINMPQFDIYIRSYSGAEDYTTASKIGNSPTDPKYIPRISSQMAGNTSNNQSSGTLKKDYVHIEYPNNGGWHDIIVDYRRGTGTTANADKGYLIIRSDNNASN